jgi:hypothetical protein
VTYTLYRKEADDSTTPISEHQDISVGVAAGKHRVEIEDFDFGYGLYADSFKVASFADGRIGYREWAMRTGSLNPSVEDRFDHDLLVEHMSRRGAASNRSLKWLLMNSIEDLGLLAAEVCNENSQTPGVLYRRRCASSSVHVSHI